MVNNFRISRRTCLKGLGASLALPLLETMGWADTGKLLAYALCRQLEGYDEIVVDHLMETIAKDDYRMQPLISEIVTSYPFVNRRIQEPVALSSNAK